MRVGAGLGVLFVLPGDAVNHDCEGLAGVSATDPLRASDSRLDLGGVLLARSGLGCGLARACERRNRAGSPAGGHGPPREVSLAGTTRLRCGY
jgi:hypothetical protein